MKDITLHINNNATATCVPNAFIDDLMIGANGEFVKIYLYLLRCMNSSEGFSISKIADKFDHTEKDIRRALKYWEKMHVLQLEYDQNEQLTGICLLDSAAHTQNHAAPIPSVSASDIPLPSVCDSNTGGSEYSRPSYSKDQLLSFRQDESTGDLLFIIERYMGQPLSRNDYDTILYWYNELHFSTDLIEYLVESCVDKGHKNIRYMDKVALSWVAASIHTVEEAKNADNIHSQTYYGVMKAFGISGRKLVEFERNFISKWTNTYGFSLDIIAEACKRTIQATGQSSFQYADSILENWHRSSIRHLEDIAVLDSAYKKSKTASSRNITVSKPAANNNRFNNFSQRSYNFDQLEKQLLNSSTQ